MRIYVLLFLVFLFFIPNVKSVNYEEFNDKVDDCKEGYYDKLKNLNFDNLNFLKERIEREIKIIEKKSQYTNNDYFKLALYYSVKTTIYSLLNLGDYYVFFDDFQSKDVENWDFEGKYGNESYIEINDFFQEGNYIFKGYAKDSLFDIGKAYLSKDFHSDLKKNDFIEAEADYYIESKYIDGRMTLIDLECRDCGIKEKPGIRVWVEDGYFAIGRSKLGINSGKWKTNTKVPTGEFRLKLFLKLGERGEGLTKLYLNNELILEEIGTNIPVFSNSSLLKEESLNYIQMGLTAAGSSLDEAIIYMDNVKISFLYK